MFRASGRRKIAGLLFITVQAREAQGPDKEPDLMNQSNVLIQASKLLPGLALIAVSLYIQGLLDVRPYQPQYLNVLAGTGLGLLIIGGLKQTYALFFFTLLSLLVILGDFTPNNLIFSSLYALIIAFQSAAIYTGFYQFRKGSHHLASSHDYLTFFAVCTCVCFLCSALFTLNESALYTHETLKFQVMLEHFLASITGILIFSSLLAAIKHQASAPLKQTEWLEQFAWLVMFMAISSYMLTHHKSHTLLLLPLVIWAATRFKPQFCSAGIALCACLAFASYEAAPEKHSTTLAEWLVHREYYLAWILALLGSLYFNTLIYEKKRTESRLEELVHERTLALSLANQELKDEIFVREQAERSQRNSSKRYRSLIETAGIPIIVLDHNTCVRQWNRAAEQAFGFTREQIIGKNFIDHFIPETQQDEMAWKLTRIQESGINQNNIESQVISYEGLTQTMLWNINQLPSMSDEGGDSQFLMIGQNISDIRKTQDQLHYLAHFDALTGCANRRLFEDRCAQAIQSAIRHKHSVALIGLDIDHFKRINDTLGHDCGDAFLVELSNRLKQCVRREDTIARLGGDEFAVLLANINGQEGAELVARNMLENITRPVQLQGHELIITSSIGITLCPADGTHYPDLLKNSDMAMYRAKNAGRNNIQFYSPEMNEEMERQLTIEQELRIALRDEQFEIHYQPIVDIESGEVVALEALLRWTHPHRGLLRPEYFLQTAEQTGLLNDIGAWALRKTCEEGGQIQAFASSPIQIALNISTRQYNHPNLVQMVREVTEQTGFDPKNLILELSESTITANSERSLATLQALSQMGLSLTIDGFGTGLSSLRQINRIPIDIIKIDRSFVSRIPEDENDMAITETLLSIATHMDLKTFATGVETNRQEAFLKINGCRYAQGYLYAAPLPFEQVQELFNALRNGEPLTEGKQIYLPFSHELH